MRVLFFADIFGRTGRRAVSAALPDLVAEFKPDFVFGNAENLAGGRGVNQRTFREMMSMGFHAMTTGNHVWDNREVFSILEADKRLLRPANFIDPADSPCPGAGHAIFENNGKSVLLVNLIGRVFMDDSEDPFATVDWIVENAPPGVPVVVDMHAEASSEKYAMAWYLAGRVSAVLGSHTHVQTADERVLPGGTAYITDVGMSGAFDSVIGLDPEAVVHKFRTKRPQPFQPAVDNPGVCCVVVDIGDDGKATGIQRIRRHVGGFDFQDERD